MWYITEEDCINQTPYELRVAPLITSSGCQLLHREHTAG